jgi:streptomycin 6-kinase
MNILPDDFTNRYLNMYGKEGSNWLSRFPDLRDEMRKLWSLTDHQPLKNLSYNYLEFGKTPQGNEIVLKIGFPHPELETEIHTLGIYNGKGAVKLYNAVPEKGVLLLERVVPGSDLLTVCDDQNATMIACQVMKNLWRPTPTKDQFPTMATWCQGLDRYLETGTRAGPLPTKLIRKAQILANDLLTTKTDVFLLHGDLHHKNILLGSSGNWLVIDPKGIIGEKAFEIAPFLYNPIPELLQQKQVERLVLHRMKVIQENTGIDYDRMVAWSFVRSILAAIWDIEDGGDNWNYWIRFSKILNNLRG